MPGATSLFLLPVPGLDARIINYDFSDFLSLCLTGGIVVWCVGGVQLSPGVNTVLLPSQPGRSTEKLGYCGLSQSSQPPTL